MELHRFSGTQKVPQEAHIYGQLLTRSQEIAVGEEVSLTENYNKALDNAFHLKNDL
jgi:hypothetical protein